MSATMDEAVLTPLEQVSLHISRRLREAAFGCLRSFLWELARVCGAHEAGLVSMAEGRIALRRCSLDEDLSAFTGIEETLSEAIRDEDGKITLNGLARYRWIPGSERVTTGRNVILRRVWPAAAWQDHRKETTYWLYLLSPAAILPQLRESPSDEDVEQIGELMSAFIRWKNEVFSQHEELLKPEQDKAREVLSEFGKFVVRPVRPDHFHSVLSSFRPKNSTPAQWSDYVAELASSCTRPRDERGCRCYAEVAEGCALPFSCPQTSAMDEGIEVLGRLEVWRTEFWNPAEGEMGGSRQRLLERGVEGLRRAVPLLIGNEKSQIDFGLGAVGLKGERALVRYFCARAIERLLKLLVPVLRTGGGELPIADLELLAGFGSLASTLLGDGRWTPEAIQNLLQVVALFGHRVLEIPVRVDLVRHLRQTLRGETALHTLKSRYRDHFFHTLEVCFLGFLILTSRRERHGAEIYAEELLRNCAEWRQQRKREDANHHSWPLLAPTADTLLAQWWVAALVHDTAYGIDILEGTLKLLDFFKNRSEVGRLINGAREKVEELAGPLSKIAPELEGDRSLKRGDHGLIAASSLDAILQAIGPETAKKFSASVRAVAFHNTRHPRIDAGIDPIGALLVLCDTVQEWGRSSLGFDRSPAVLLSRMTEASTTPREDQFGPVKRYGLSLEASVSGDRQEYIWSTPKGLRIEVDYGPECLKECRAKFTWVDMTYNLQRVDFQPWGIDLAVQIAIPFPEKEKEEAPNMSMEAKTPDRTQFEHFGDFVRQQQVRFLEEWYHMASRRDEAQAVCYGIKRREESSGTWVNANQVQHADAREVVTLNLGLLGKLFAEERALMGGHVGNFNDAIKEWSVYSREQIPAAAAQRPPV